MREKACAERVRRDGIGLSGWSCSLAAGEQLCSCSEGGFWVMCAISALPAVKDVLMPCLGKKRLALKWVLTAEELWFALCRSPESAGPALGVSVIKTQVVPTGCKESCWISPCQCEWSGRAALSVLGEFLRVAGKSPRQLCPTCAVPALEPPHRPFPDSENAVTGKLLRAG